MKTRTERYQELREKLSSEVQQDTPNPKLSGYAKRLNEIDNERFGNIDYDDSEYYEPTRVKDVELRKYETFENEYLKDFLDEVKEYNIEKGHRHVDDTEQNILEELGQSSFSMREEKTVDLESFGLVEDEVEIIEDDFERVEEEFVTSDPVHEEAFENLLKEVTREHDVLLDENDEDYQIGTTVESNFESITQPEIVQEEEIGLDEIFNEDIEETHSQTEEHDPFWEEYLKKMNDLEENPQEIYEGKRDEVLRKKIEEPVKETEVIEEKVLERDITAEFLALTQEIEKENLTSIDLDSTTNQEVIEETMIEEEDLVEENEVYELDESEIRGNRLVNAALTIALAGIVLGVAVAIKYFLLG